MSSFQRIRERPLRGGRLASRRTLLLVASMAAGVSLSALAQSQSGSGQVSVYHLNAAIQGRGACVQLSPALPQTPWACLWQSNALYKETNALLLAAYLSGKPCALVLLDQKDALGLWQITTAQCQ